MTAYARWLTVLGLMLAAGSAAAATATTTFAVSGTVVPTCTVSTPAMSFGTSIPNPINTAVDVQGNVTATCSAGAPYTIAMSVGSGAGATYSGRQMTAGGSTMTYNLYIDSGRTTVWGDGTGGSDIARGAGTGAAQNITVYGRIRGGQSVPTGSYTDTVNVTLTF